MINKANEEYTNRLVAVSTALRVSSGVFCWADHFSVVNRIIVDAYDCKKANKKLSAMHAFPDRFISVHNCRFWLGLTQISIIYNIYVYMSI